MPGGVAHDRPQVVGRDDPRLARRFRRPGHDEHHPEERDLIVRQALARKDVEHAGEVVGRDDGGEPAAARGGGEGGAQDARGRVGSQRSGDEDEPAGLAGPARDRPPLGRQRADERRQKSRRRGRTATRDQDRDAALGKDQRERRQARVEQAGGDKAGKRQGRGERRHDGSRGDVNGPNVRCPPEPGQPGAATFLVRVPARHCGALPAGPSRHRVLVRQAPVEPVRRPDPVGSRPPDLGGWAGLTRIAITLDGISDRPRA